MVGSDRDAEHYLGRVLRLVVWGHLPVIAAWAALSTVLHPAGAPRRLAVLAVLAIGFGVVLHAAEGDPTPSAGEGTTEFLAKPFTADQLLARVRSALDIVRREGA